MGHTKLGPLPRTRTWLKVTGLITGGASVSEVAGATLDAANSSINKARDDPAFQEAARLITVIPLAAKRGNLGAFLHGLGVSVHGAIDIHDVVVATERSIDASSLLHRGRTDLGDMARATLAETLYRAARDVGGLFGDSRNVIEDRLATHGTAAGFRKLARRFLVRLNERLLQYHLTREIPAQVGDGLRFESLAQSDAFNQALRNDCDQRGGYVEQFAQQWFSKADWESEGHVSTEDALDFVYGGLKKLNEPLHAEVA